MQLHHLRWRGRVQARKLPCNFFHTPQVYLWFESHQHEQVLAWWKLPSSFHTLKPVA